VKFLINALKSDFMAKCDSFSKTMILIALAFNFFTKIDFIREIQAKNKKKSCKSSFYITFLPSILRGL
jgi:hypothetical protein